MFENVMTPVLDDSTWHIGPSTRYICILLWNFENSVEVPKHSIGSQIQNNNVDNNDEDVNR